jgi:hypothetical protein
VIFFLFGFVLGRLTALLSLPSSPHLLCLSLLILTQTNKNDQTLQESRGKLDFNARVQFNCQQDNLPSKALTQGLHWKALQVKIAI